MWENAKPSSGINKPPFSDTAGIDIVMNYQNSINSKNRSNLRQKDGIKKG